MKSFLKNNSLSLVFLILFILTLGAQSYLGHKQHNQELSEDGLAPVNYTQYLRSGHFFESTFENWESEFLQMGMFVVLSAFLFQKGSSESKDPSKHEKVDDDPDPGKKGAPWPVRKGGWILKLYSYSLSIVFFLLFTLSFILHWYGSLEDYNLEQSAKHKPLSSAISYLGNSRFWFESFQNWQSEFLSIFAMVFLSIYFRYKGSPQSKPVDMPIMDTGK